MISESVNSEITAYHGTNAHVYSGGKIEQFNTNTERGAAFFSSEPMIAKQYGEKIYKVGIKLENPLIVHGNGQHWSNLIGSTKVSGTITPKLRSFDSSKTNEINHMYKELGGAEPDIVSVFHGHDILTKHHTLSHLTDASTTDDIAKAAKRHGYDGVIFKDIHDSPVHDKNLYQKMLSDVYAVFDSKKIKIL